MLSSTHCMKRKILIVEDDPVHQSHLVRLVTRLGHDPVPLASGQDALDAIMKRRDPSMAAVLLDLVMPELDGMGVITRLRAAGYHTPIIVLVKPAAIDSALAAIAASMAFPPAASISAPAAEASGWFVATIPREPVAGRFSQTKALPARVVQWGMEVSCFRVFTVCFGRRKPMT